MCMITWTQSYGYTIHTCIHSCVHTYMHTCSHLHIHTYKHTYIHTYTCLRMYTHAYTRLHDTTITKCTRKQIKTHTTTKPNSRAKRKRNNTKHIIQEHTSKKVHTCIHTCMYTCTPCVHVYVHEYTHIYMRVRTYVHTYMHACVQACILYIRHTICSYRTSIYLGKSNWHHSCGESKSFVKNAYTMADHGLTLWFWYRKTWDVYGH